MSQKNYKVRVLEQDPGDFNLSFKLIIIGDSGVGKSCLSSRATKNTFNSMYSPTIGFDFMTFYINIEDLCVKLQIWDTCGQEVYRSLISSFYHNSSLALLVYSIQNKNSFKNLESWINEVKTNGNPDINLFLIGNKVDLEDERVISKEMAEEFAKNNNIHLFMETSAKTGFNAQNVFIEAAKLLYEQHLTYKERASKPETLLNHLSDNNESNVHLDPIQEDEEDVKKKPSCKSKCC